jgi:Subtilase family
MLSSGLRRTGLRRTGAGAAAVAVAAAVLGLLPVLPAVPAVADSVRFQQQWVFDALGLTDPSPVSEGAGVVVAVIDSGINPDVSDLSGSVIDGPDYTGVHTSPNDADWGEHGTWMASIIAGHGHDGGGDGIIGVAPESRVLSVRVIPDKGDPGYGAYNQEPEEQIQDELAEGIKTAVKDKAKVISMSIGYSQASGTVREAIQYAYSRGAVLVASSGNSGDNDTQHGSSGTAMAPVSFPAEYPGVISVGAVARGGAAASFSSNNLSVQVAAPGMAVPAQGRNGLYYTVDGTSPACALVAGVAALIESRYPGISPALVTQALTSTAQQSGGGGYNVRTGFGIVDADAALARAGQLLTEKQPGSQVPSAAHFGGGAAAVPAAPVTPRGDGRLVAYLLLALLSLAVAGGGLYGRRRMRAGQP